MNVLLIHAHPEPKSFCSALKDIAVATLQAGGHSVEVHDLWAMNFNPVASKSDFVKLAEPDHFRYNREGGYAMASPGEPYGGFSEDIAREMRALAKADLLLVTAPVWWFSVPAILKGWFDRVLALSFAYGHGATYEKGLLRGKKAMLLMTSGGPQAQYQDDGANGDFHTNFWHVEHGVFRYCGMDVLEPFVAWGAGRADEASRTQMLQNLVERMTTIESASLVQF